MDPKVSIIAAIGKNRELGAKNKLLWHIPGELKRFKELTTGHIIIMGRKTYESIGRPLPNRINIVITRDPSFTLDGHGVVAHSLAEALETAKDREVNEIFIIGGGQIYKEALPVTDRLYLTLVDAEFPEADTFFPEYPEFTKEVSREERATEQYKYAYVVLER